MPLLVITACPWLCRVSWSRRLVEATPRGATVTMAKLRASLEATARLIVCARAPTVGAVRAAPWLLDGSSATSSARASRAFSSADASSFLDVEAARERARLKAAALAAQGAADAGAMLVFDRAVKAAQRDRAAWLRRTHPSGDASDPFLEEVTRRTLDRLHDVKREFPRVLVLGGAGDQVTRRLLRDRPDVRAVVVVDASRDMLALARRRVGDEACIDDPNPSSLDSQTVRNAAGHDVRVHYVHADEEALPLRDESVDAAVSVLGLHWANDLPGAMSQARKALTPDGLFLSAVLGGETLREMRIACAVAELEREGGVSQRVSPLAQVRDCGNLLTRAGMRLPAVDVDTLTMQYPDPMKLVDHLRIMGETNAALSRRAGPIARTTAAAAAACYQSMFPAEGGPPPELAPENGDARARGVECTFQVMYMTGWSPGEGQQQAAERGSAGVSLAKLEEELAKIPKK